MRRRGFTLIELMVAVAIGGILVTTASAGLGFLQRRSAQTLHEERALQVLEYQAAAHVQRVPPDAAVRDALLAELPHATLTSSFRDGLTTWEVRWRTGGEVRSRRLSVLGRVR